MLNSIADNQVKLAAIGQRISCSANQVLCCIQVQFQSKRQGDGSWFGGLVIRVIADLGKMLLG